MIGTTPLFDYVVFKAPPNRLRWHVTRDDELVNEYSLQFIAERAATRLAALPPANARAPMAGS